MRPLPLALALAACPPPPIPDPDDTADADVDSDTGDTDSGDTDTGDPDSGDTDTGDPDTGDTDSGDPDTGGGWTAVPFVATDLVIPPTVRFDAGALYAGDDATWTGLVNRPAPPRVAGKAHIVVYPKDEAFPGSTVRVDSLERPDEGGAWRVRVTVRVPDGCPNFPIALPVGAAVQVDAAARPEVVVDAVALEKVACSGNVPDLGACDVARPCADGLVCHGLTTTTLDRGEGTCRDASFSGVFTAASGGAIPDNDPDGLRIPVVVSRMATVSEDVGVRLTLTHPDPAELVVSVINPDGTEAVVRDRQTGDAGGVTRSYVAVGFPGDESANGTWYVRVVDTAAGDTGTVGAPQIALTTRLD